MFPPILSKTYTNQENEKKTSTSLIKLFIMQKKIMCVCVQAIAWVHRYLLQLLFYYKRKCGSNLASTLHRDDGEGYDDDNDDYEKKNNNGGGCW